eukprot:16442451-Heterocapsa_arctica.AAC.1
MAVIIKQSEMGKDYNFITEKACNKKLGCRRRKALFDTHASQKLPVNNETTIENDIVDQGDEEML